MTHATEMISDYGQRLNEHFPKWKRGLDLALIVITAPVTVPLLALVALGNLLFIGRPILFIQERPGLGCRLFKLIKFRTMLNKKDKQGAMLPDNERLTRYGRLLRSTSLDELPELYNVIKGEMSIVGPRPLLIEYLTRYSPRQLRRHEAPPGITGWAQIHGRNTLDWNQVFEHDLWYVENMSPLLDLKIVFQTALKVVKREGVTSTTSATREKFRGNK